MAKRKGVISVCDNKKKKNSVSKEDLIMAGMVTQNQTPPKTRKKSYQKKKVKEPKKATKEKKPKKNEQQHKHFTEESLEFEDKTINGFMFNRIRIVGKGRNKDVLEDVVSIESVENKENDVLGYLANENCFVGERTGLNDLNPKFYACLYCNPLCDEFIVDKVKAENEDGGNKVVQIKIPLKSDWRDSKQYLCHGLAPTPDMYIKQPCYFPIPVLEHPIYYVIYRFYHLRGNIDDLAVFQVFYE